MTAIYKKVAESVVILICIVVILISFFSLLKSQKDSGHILTILGYKPAIIISGSMKPFLYPGDMTISKVVNPGEIKAGDVISYRVEGNIPVTHRVVKVTDLKEKILFETKGDANNSKDDGLVSSDRIVGKLVYMISKVGYISKFLKTKFGFIVVIIIPLIMVILFELFSVFNNVQRKDH